MVNLLLNVLERLPTPLAVLLMLAGCWAAIAGGAFWVSKVVGTVA